MPSSTQTRTASRASRNTYLQQLVLAADTSALRRQVAAEGPYFPEAIHGENEMLGSIERIGVVTVAA
jgi:hypothetical protein